MSSELTLHNIHGDNRDRRQIEETKTKFEPVEIGWESQTSTSSIVDINWKQSVVLSRIIKTRVCRYTPIDERWYQRLCVATHRLMSAGIKDCVSLHTD
jgi:hypothetical protein